MYYFCFVIEIQNNQNLNKMKSNNKISAKKMAELAPKYGLFIEGAGWLAETQNLTGVLFTEHKELARNFSVGFDDVNIKTGIWNAEVGKLFNCDIKFEAIYL